MIPISEIENLIETIERRMLSASKLMAETRDVEQLHRVSGKHEAYVSFVRELKELLPE